MFVRARYGHGGRLGYDREWRADPELSGGGELIDQGVAPDRPLALVPGRLRRRRGRARTYFWDMPVDDNAFLAARNGRRARSPGCTRAGPSGRTSSRSRSTAATASSRSTASAAATASERLTFYQMLPEMGPPETTTWEYPWRTIRGEPEFADFVADIRAGRRPARRSPTPRADARDRRSKSTRRRGL